MTQLPDEPPPWAKDLLAQFQALSEKVERFSDRLDTYQKASDRVANLAFTVVTASAAVVVLVPAVKVLAEFFASTMIK
jgi:hypothetical protein